MSDDDKFLRYTKAIVMETTKTTFGKLIPGNLFYLHGNPDVLFVSMIPNKEINVLGQRNCASIVAKDPSYCGMSLFLDDRDIVEVVRDSNVTLKGYYEV
jgi:hypothetical protein